MSADRHDSNRTRAVKWLKSALLRSTVVRRLAARRGEILDHRPTKSFDEMRPTQALRLAFNVVLRREPDQAGEATYLPRVQSGEISNDQLVEWLWGSEEFHTQSRFTSLGPSLHLSRCQFIQSLPKAQRILDLGGTHLGSDSGALVQMGYPYPFEELVIIDLPLEDRHEIYRARGALDRVDSVRGPVQYRYHSMADLSAFEDESFDLVYSGQTIEHVTPQEGDHVLAEAWRVLAPGGHLAIDTPNGRATRMQQDEFIDPDHEVEYEHGELSAKIRGAGFEIIDAKGINYLGDGAAKGIFSMEDTASNQGIYSEIEDCYLLAYICQKK